MSNSKYKTARTFDVIAFLIIVSFLAYLIINGAVYAYQFINQLFN